jgi:ribosome modulation factor
MKTNQNETMNDLESGLRGNLREDRRKLADLNRSGAVLVPQCMLEVGAVALKPKKDEAPCELEKVRVCRGVRQSTPVLMMEACDGKMAIRASYPTMETSHFGMAQLVSREALGAGLSLPSETGLVYLRDCLDHAEVRPEMGAEMLELGLADGDRYPDVEPLLHAPGRRAKVTLSLDRLKRVVATMAKMGAGQVLMDVPVVESSADYEHAIVRMHASGEQGLQMVAGLAMSGASIRVEPLGRTQDMFAQEARRAASELQRQADRDGTTMTVELVQQGKVTASATIAPRVRKAKAEGGGEAPGEEHEGTKAPRHEGQQEPQMNADERGSDAGTEGELSDDDRVAEEELRAACFAEGERARVIGEGCPYDDETLESEAWHEGYENAGRPGVEVKGPTAEVARKAGMDCAMMGEVAVCPFEDVECRNAWHEGWEAGVELWKEKYASPGEKAKGGDTDEHRQKRTSTDDHGTGNPHGDPSELRGRDRARAQGWEAAAAGEPMRCPYVREDYVKAWGEGFEGFHAKEASADGVDC